MQQYGVEEKFVRICKGCIKGLKQVWCWKEGSQDGFRLKQGYVKVVHCHRCYIAYT